VARLGARAATGYGIRGREASVAVIVLLCHHCESVALFVTFEKIFHLSPAVKRFPAIAGAFTPSAGALRSPPRSPADLQRYNSITLACSYQYF
jgi:hypothetical protein